MIPSSSYPHSISVVPPTLRQPTGTHENGHSDLIVVGWGFILILMLLVSRRLVLAGYRRHQFQRSVTLLQRQTALEQLLTRKATFKQAPKKGEFRQP